ncbi:modin [Fusarium longipes]|uniref:Modin n=1 Tax=Fusarium longipes TaxID=694270 RepID=A0A395T1J5_9HYPO|nr:modin [Fusarium longipes]
MNSTRITNAPRGDTNNDIIIACVALAISTVALFIALLQALQQYYASATGYASCKELVIGKWSNFTHRRLRLFEFRFEVEFQTPVIFVSAPSNTRGPLGLHGEEEEKSILRYLQCSVWSRFTGLGRLPLQDEKTQEVCRHEITYMVGTQDSYQKTYTWNQDIYDERIRCLNAGETRQAIRTADNELVTWLTLLMAVQRMERESRQWQAEMFFGYDVPYNEWRNRPSHTPLVGNFDIKDANSLHTLTVGMQKKKRSWDTMPEHMKKPYATSTICHIVEIIAMLGIHWKVFNRNENRYRAQGNGFFVTGANIDDLGITFSFQKTGQTWFKENRIIPADDVKELCFGYCPTIFRPRNFKIYAEEPKDIGTLQFASFAAMAETLKVIGCNTKTVNYFSKSVEDTRYSHLFPVAFEMLGMVGSVLQIKGTAFRMLPNPTIHHWDRKSFSLRAMLVAYKSVLDEASKYQEQEAQDESRNAEAMFTDNDQIRMIIKGADEIENNFIESEQKISDPEARQAQEEWQDQFVTEHHEPGQGTEEPRLYSCALINALHTAIEKCDVFLKKKPVIRSVLRVHLQEILSMLNLRDTDYGPAENCFQDALTKEGFLIFADQSSKAHRINRQQLANKYHRAIFQKLQRLDSASSGEKHALLMDLYIFWVREMVILKLCNELDRQRTRQGPQSDPQRAQRTKTLLEGPPAGDEDGLKDDGVDVEDCWTYVDSQKKQEISDVWCTFLPWAEKGGDCQLRITKSGMNSSRSARGTGFYCVWIVQEVFVSRHAIVLCGEMELSWSDIFQAIQYLADAGLGLTLGLQRFNQLHNLDYLRRCYLKGQTVDSLHLLVQARRAQAKQAEDHIFAFRGFYHNAESFGFDLTLPKYPMDYDVVYVQTANKMFRYYQTLDILSIHRIGIEIPPPDCRPLPSWVPDWSEGDTCEAFVWRNIHPDFTQEQRARYRATGSSRYHEFMRDGDRILKVEGWKMDEVLCADPAMDPRYDHGVIDDITAQMSDILNTQETYISWDVVAGLHMSQAYVTGEPRCAAYKATLLGGCLFEDEDNNLTVLFWLCRMSLVPFQILYILRLNKVWVMKIIFYCVAARTWFMRPILWLIPFPAQIIYRLLPVLQAFPKLATLIARRRVIRTDQGLIGLVLAQTLPGKVGNWLETLISMASSYKGA